jgi:hypothetical protein
MPVAHFVIFKWVMALGYSDVRAVANGPFRAPIFGTGLAKFVGKQSALGIFGKRLLRDTAALAYKIARFCLVPFIAG